MEITLDITKEMTAPIPQEITFDSQNGQYSIKIKSSSLHIIILLSKNDILPHKKYKGKYNLEELQTKSKWFLLFDSIETTINELIFLVKDKKVLIKEEQGKLSISFLIKLWNIEDITLDIFQIEDNPLDVIQDICSSINQMSNSLSTLVKDFKSLKENYDFIKLYNRGKIIEEHQLNSINKDFLEVIKAKISNKPVTFKLIYSTLIDEAKSENFHHYCDNQGRTLVVITTSKNITFGGYTSQPWDKSEYYKPDEDAFLFSNQYKIIYPISTVAKAIFGKKSYGPCFGSTDIVCNSDFRADNHKVLFSSYSIGTQFELNGNKEQFTIKDMEVYKVLFD